jgi:hypothetical protein
MKNDIFAIHGIKVFRNSEINIVFHPDEKHMNSWGWVKLSELSRIVGLDPLALMQFYDVLSSNFIASDDKDFIQLSSVDSSNVFTRFTESKRINEVRYIPAGWAKKVLTAFSTGVDKFQIIVIKEENPIINDEGDLLWNKTFFKSFGWTLIKGFDENGVPISNPSLSKSLKY